jgi:kumamolisin
MAKSAKDQGAKPPANWVKPPANYVKLASSEPQHSGESTLTGPAGEGELIKLTIIVRRHPGGTPMKKLEDFQNVKAVRQEQVTHDNFADKYGADQAELDQVADFARAHGLQVLGTNRSRRSVDVQGTVAQVREAFAVQFNHYDSPKGKYSSYEGPVHLPAALSSIVEAVVGLDNRPVPARRHIARGSNPMPLVDPEAAGDPGEAGNPGAAGVEARHKPKPPQPAVSADPSNTVPLSPQQVAKFYNFPTGNGKGQTIGIYEMQIIDGSQTFNPGYTATDIADTIKAFGGGLTVPVPVDVAIDGQANAGVSDGETVLDITVSGAIAQGAKLAVYFTPGSSNANIIHALQAMIHPDAGQPTPTVLSISYGWFPDDDTSSSITDSDFTQIQQLFQDAATLKITVLVSSGDSGAKYSSATQAQTSYPATDPWIISCGGSTIGNNSGGKFDEYVWNDVFGGNSGATGGGVSAKFPVPAYQGAFTIPVRNTTKTKGRGIPDIAGNASPNSGYAEFQAGSSVGPTGGTSAVSPLYAGLIAIINANLGLSVGYINTLLYNLSNSAFRKITGPPGPANNSYGGVTGYPASGVWNACTGLGSVDGVALQTGLQQALGGA